MPKPFEGKKTRMDLTRGPIYSTLLRFSLPIFLQATASYCFFLALKGRRPRHEKLVTELSACTLGVYLIHPLMLNVFERVGLAVTPASPILSLLGVYVCLAAACFALVFILRKVPVLKRVL